MNADKTFARGAQIEGEMRADHTAAEVKKGAPVQSLPRQNPGGTPVLDCDFQSSCPRSLSFANAPARWAEYGCPQGVQAVVHDFCCQLGEERHERSFRYAQQTQRRSQPK